MTLLRNIFSDLVEKRLWPLAIVLVAALFVAPSVVSKPATIESNTGDAVSAAPGSAAARAAAAPLAQVSLDTVTPSGVKLRPSALHNPFVQQYVSKTDVAGGQLITPDAGASGSSSSTTLGDGTTVTTTKTTTTTKTKHKSKSQKDPSLRDNSIQLRFGEAGKLSNLPPTAPFTPLPTQENPFFVFLGVKASDPTLAVFLISSDAKATGDGTCLPDATTCDTVEMHAGDSEFLEVTNGATSTTYQLDFVKIVN